MVYIPVLHTQVNYTFSITMFTSHLASAIVQEVKDKFYQSLPELNTDRQGLPEDDSGLVESASVAN